MISENQRIDEITFIIIRYNEKNMAPVLLHLQHFIFKFNLKIMAIHLTWYHKSNENT